MNKASIVELVHDELQGTKAQAEQVVDLVFDQITEAMARGDQVSIAGFGVFETKDRAARMGRNPRTGESIKIAASRVAKFRAAKALKDAVQK